MYFFLSGVESSCFALKSMVLYGQQQDGSNVVVKVGGWYPRFYTELPSFLAVRIAEEYSQNPSPGYIMKSPFLSYSSMAENNTLSSSSLKYTYIQEEEIRKLTPAQRLMMASHYGILPSLQNTEPNDSKSKVEDLQYERRTRHKLERECLLFAFWLEYKIGENIGTTSFSSTTARDTQECESSSDTGDEDDDSTCFEDLEGKSLCPFEQQFYAELDRISTVQEEPGDLLQKSTKDIRALASKNLRIIQSVEITLKKFCIGFQDDRVQMLLRINLKSPMHWRKVAKYMCESASWAFGNLSKTPCKQQLPPITSSPRYPIYLPSTGVSFDTVVRKPTTYGTTDAPPVTQFLADYDLQFFAWVFIENAKKWTPARAGERSLFVHENNVNNPFQHFFSSKQNVGEEGIGAGCVYPLRKDYSSLLSMQRAGKGRKTTVLRSVGEEEQKKNHLPIVPARQSILNISMSCKAKGATEMDRFHYSQEAESTDIVSVALQLRYLGKEGSGDCLIFTALGSKHQSKNVSSSSFGPRSFLLKEYIAGIKGKLGLATMDREDAFDREWRHALIDHVEDSTGSDEDNAMKNPSWKIFFQKSEVFETYKNTRVISCPGGEEEILALFQQYLRTVDPQWIVYTKENYDNILLLQKKGISFSKIQNPLRRYHENVWWQPGTSQFRATQKKSSMQSTKKSPSSSTSQFIPQPQGRNIFEVTSALKKVQTPLDSYGVSQCVTNPYFNKTSNVDFPFKSGWFDSFGTPFSSLEAHGLRLVYELFGLGKVGTRFILFDQSVSSLCYIDFASVSKRGQQFRILNLLYKTIMVRNMVLNTETMNKGLFVMKADQNASSIPLLPNLTDFNPTFDPPTQQQIEELSAIPSDSERKKKILDLLRLREKNTKHSQVQKLVKTTKLQTTRRTKPKAVEKLMKQGDTSKPSSVVNCFKLSSFFQQKGKTRQKRSQVQEENSLRNSSNLSYKKVMSDQRKACGMDTGGDSVKRRKIQDLDSSSHCRDTEEEQEDSSKSFKPPLGLKSLMEDFHQEENTTLSKMLAFLGKNLTMAEYSDQKNLGGRVLEPTRTCLLRHVGSLDYASLYPSIMIAFSICFTLFLFGDTEDELVQKCLDPKNLQGKHPLYTIGWLPLTAKTVLPVVLRKRGVRNRPIIPEHLKKLMDKRQESKNKKKKATDSLEKKIHDNNQLALKVICNATYGLFGFRQGKLYMLAMSSVVSSIGRTIHEITCSFVLLQRRPAEMGEVDKLMDSESSHRQDSVYFRSQDLHPFGIDNTEAYRNIEKSFPLQNVTKPVKWKRYLSVQYGDTDSVMLTVLPPPSILLTGSFKDYILYIICAFTEIANAITKYFDNFLVMEPEDVKLLGQFWMKKFYACIIVDIPDLAKMMETDSFVGRSLLKHVALTKPPLSKGIQLKKRGLPSAFRELCNPVILCILLKDYIGLQNLILNFVDEVFFKRKNPYTPRDYYSLSVQCDVSKSTLLNKTLIHANVQEQVLQRFGLLDPEEDTIGRGGGEAASASKEFPRRSPTPLDYFLENNIMGQRVSYVVQDPASTARRLGTDSDFPIKLFNQGIPVDVAIETSSNLDVNYYIGLLLKTLKTILGHGDTAVHYEKIQQKIQKKMKHLQQQKMQGNVQSISEFFHQSK